MRIVKSSLSYFGRVFAAGFMLGILRVSLLVPQLGERTAELLEMPLMLVVMVLAARWMLRHEALAGRVSAGVFIGALALLWMVSAELLLAVALQQRSLRDYIASRDAVSGVVYLFMLVLYAALPAVLAAKARD